MSRCGLDLRLVGFNANLFGHQFGFALSDPFFHILGGDAASIEVHHVLDVLFAEVQGIDQEEDLVGIWKCHLVR